MKKRVFIKPYARKKITCTGATKNKQPINLFMLKRSELFRTKQLFLQECFNKNKTNLKFAGKTAQTTEQILKTIDNDFEKISNEVKYKQSSTEDLDTDFFKFNPSDFSLKKQLANTDMFDIQKNHQNQINKSPLCINTNKRKDHFLVSFGEAITSKRIFYSERKRRRNITEIQQIDFTNGAKFMGKVFHLTKLINQKVLCGIGSFRTFNNIVFKGTFLNNELTRGTIQFFDTFSIKVRSKQKRKNQRVFCLIFNFHKKLTIHFKFTNFYEQTNESFQMTHFKYKHMATSTHKFVPKVNEKSLTFYNFHESFGVLFNDRPFSLFLGETRQMKAEGKGIKLFSGGGFVDGNFRRGIEYGLCKSFDPFSMTYSEGKMFNKIRLGVWRKFDSVGAAYSLTLVGADVRVRCRDFARKGLLPF